MPHSLLRMLKDKDYYYISPQCVAHDNSPRTARTPNCHGPETAAKVSGSIHDRTETPNSYTAAFILSDLPRMAYSVKRRTMRMPPPKRPVWVALKDCSGPLSPKELYKPPCSMMASVNATLNLVRRSVRTHCNKFVQPRLPM